MNNKFNSKGHILLIDDNNHLSANLKKILESKQYSVDCVDNAEKGIFFCQSKKYDLIFFSMRHPKLSDLEIANEIEKISPSTGCFFITDFSSQKITGSEQQQKYVFPFSQKPLDIEMFFSIIEQIIQQKNVERMINRFEEIKNSIAELSEFADSSQNLKILNRSIHRTINELTKANNYHVVLCENNKALHCFLYYVKRTCSRELKESKSEINESVQIKWLGVPLKLNNKIIGTLVVKGYSTINQFKQANREILCFISNQLAKNIEYYKSEFKIQNDFNEKKLLIKEIHHHFCNNQQLINSAIKNQTEDSKNKNTLKNLDDIRNRIYSITLVQRELYKSKNPANINCKAVIQKIVNGLYMTYFHTMPGLCLKLDIQNVILDMNRAMLCSMILNELVSNSFKHAFPSTWKNKKLVSVNFRPSNNNHVELIVNDNGVGLPRELDFRNTKSVGFSLVQKLEKQLNGKISLDRRKGTKVQISFENTY